MAFLNLGGQEILVILFVFLPIVLFITALIQCLGARFKEANAKVIWALVILLLPLLGPILWFLVGKGQIEEE